MTTVEEPGLTVVCTYRVKPGCEADFESLLKGHIPTLRRLGLVTERPSLTLSPQTPEHGYVEVFTWTSSDAAERAGEVPEVIEVWEPMADLCESKDGHPAMEFKSFNEIEPNGE